VDFAPSPQTRAYIDRVGRFIDTETIPREHDYLETLRRQENCWAVPDLIGELKAKACAEGLWNLFLPDPDLGAGLSVTEYAPLAELMGRSLIANWSARPE
jgi:alkylation response protein AidB-like acyl-CoA dehydrogenase